MKGEKYPKFAGFNAIDCTSGSMNKVAGLEVKKAFSPMLIGPAKYGADPEAAIFENLWQYGKCFRGLRHIDGNGEPTEIWRQWRNTGYKSTKGDRHPQGTKTDKVKFIGEDGKRRFEYLQSEFARYGGEKMDYLTARKKVYAPTYAKLVRDTKVFVELRRQVLAGENIQIVDLDGPKDEERSHVVTAELLRRKINDPTASFGHGYILAGLLAGIEPEEYTA